MKWPSPSVCQSLDFEKETFWFDSCFPYKVSLPVVVDQAVVVVLKFPIDKSRTHNHQGLPYSVIPE